VTFARWRRHLPRRMISRSNRERLAKPTLFAHLRLKNAEGCEPLDARFANVDPDISAYAHQFPPQTNGWAP
jgi:hypothetical protein